MVFQVQDICTSETTLLYNLLEMSEIARAEEEQVLAMEVND